MADTKQKKWKSQKIHQPEQNQQKKTQQETSFLTVVFPDKIPRSRLYTSVIIMSKKKNI